MERQTGDMHSEKDRGEDLGEDRGVGKPGEDNGLGGLPPLAQPLAQVHDEGEADVSHDTSGQDEKENGWAYQDGLREDFQADFGAGFDESVNDPLETDLEASLLVGYVDGAAEASTQRFMVVLDEKATVELDELLVTSQNLPDGSEVSHFGIVVEVTSEFEGAEWSSDTVRIAAGTQPGTVSNRVEVEILRTLPETWIAPQPGVAVRRASGVHRRHALFLDQMEQPLPVGLDMTGSPVYADWAFINGEKGGHVNISGVSGVATKTSYALFLLYQLFETPQGRALLGVHAPATHALVMNVKGQDLLHIDRGNTKFASNAAARSQWAALGVPDPGPFTDVELYAPRSPHSVADAAVADVPTRRSDEVTVFGWSPEQFIRQGLLQYVFGDPNDRNNQVELVVQRAQLQLARWARPVVGKPGAVTLIAPGNDVPMTFERAVRLHHAPRLAGEGELIENWADLVEILSEKLTPDSPDFDESWVAGAAVGTLHAFMRRLYKQTPRMGHLVHTSVSPVELRRAVSVVDIHALHDDGQRFVVGALLSKVFQDSQGAGREPLTFIVLDELNKYAPRMGTSPLKEIMVDIAARGRSLGVILVGAQQSAGDVEEAVVRNASLRVVGRLDAGETADYAFLTPEQRVRASRVLPGTMFVAQPVVPVPIPCRFPFPPYATNAGEGAPVAAEQEAYEEETFDRL